MDFNKHYIRIDTDNRVIHGFSSAFEEPLNDDICINENGGRHFELFGKANPPLFTLDSIPLYKWDDKQVLQRADDEIETDRQRIADLPSSKGELMRQLEEIDERSIRSLRAICVGADIPKDMEMLEILENEAVKIRTQLQSVCEEGGL
jgi:hypothetical protein